MRKWKRQLIWVGAAVAVLFFAPFLIPMSSYTKQAESLAANALGVPVSIGSLHIALLPTPRLNVSNVVIGAHNEFGVASVSVIPALASLFSDTKVISSVQVIKPVIKKSALDILAGLSKKPAGEPEKPTVTVRQINIEQAKLIWPDLELPEINADITLTPDNRPEAATIESVDGKLKLDLIPEEGRQLIKVTANAWTLPAGPPLLINQLQMDMVLTANKLEISKIDSTLYGGKLTGDADLTWDKTYKLGGKTRLDNIAVREPVRLMSQSTRVSGQLFSSGQFSATAKEPAQLMDNLRADIKFNVKDGVLYGFDLAKAPAMLIGQGKGGETKFDELSGLLGISGKTYRFRDLKISSGLMKAGGDVKITPNKNLDGVMKVEVKNSMQVAAIPLQISGTLDKPQVFPTKSAIAGAVAGTTVLGPAGTGLGIKAGEALSNLFGSDKK